MAENLLSKVKIGDVTYNLKDATSRANLETLVGTHGITALGDAAWKAFCESLSGSANLPTDAAVKTYVDSEIGKINKFDVVVPGAVEAQIPAGAVYKDGATEITGTLAASASTMYKLYLVKNSNAGAGAHVEYITIRSGAGTEADPYTFAWEQIGTTVVDLSNYVTKTTEIAGLDIGTGIAKTDLQNALGLENLAYTDTASGTVPGQTISGVKATGDLTASLTGALSVTNTTATIAAKADYQPAGTVAAASISADGDFVVGGSIDVTIIDETETSAATLSRASYTPAGSITVTLNNNAIYEITDVGSLPTYTAESVTGGKATVVDTTKFDGGSAATWTGKSYTAATFTEGTFTTNVPTAIDVNAFNGGTAATFTQGSKASLTAATTSSFAKKVLKPAIDSTDSECLVFNWVADDTAAGETGAFSNAVTDRGTFTANGDDNFTANTVASLGDGFYTAGTAASKVADTFNAGTLTWGTFDGGTAASLASGFVTAGTDVSYTASTYTIGTLPTRAVKTVGIASTGFTGTPEADLKVTGAAYLKQKIGTATLTVNKAKATFTGATVPQLIPTEISYEKTTIGTLGITVTLPTGGLTVGDISVAATSVTVSPN